MHRSDLIGTDLRACVFAIFAWKRGQSHRRHLRRLERVQTVRGVTCIGGHFGNHAWWDESHKQMEADIVGGRWSAGRDWHAALGRLSVCQGCGGNGVWGVVRTHFFSC